MGMPVPYLAEKTMALQVSINECSLYGCLLHKFKGICLSF
jgi:hypothetical protein